MIQVEDFTKRYGNHTAVCSVTFAAESGHVTGLLGTNGAGKTTILKAVCGIHYATTGRVLVQGLDVAQNPIQAKELVGYVSENPSLIDGFSVKNFLIYAAKIRIASIGQNNLSGDINEVVDRVCNQCSLEGVMSKKINELSKGFRQRLSFAQALLHNPPVLVLDEPVSGLDPAQIHHIRSLIRQLAKQKTILLSTHLMQEVEALCDTVHVLSKGKLVASGSIEDITKQTGLSSFEDAFLCLSGKNMGDME